jgi:phage terminase large subunit
LAAVEAWIHGGTLYVHREAFKHHLELDATPAFLKRKIPGIQNHAMRVDNSRPESISYFQRHGLPRAIACKKGAGSVMDGVAFIRAFDEVVIHHTCKEMAFEFLHYRYKTDRLSNDVLPIIIDAHNHGIDGLRYAIEPIMRASLGPMIGFVQ